VVLMFATLFASAMVAYLGFGWRADVRAERLRVARHEELLAGLRDLRAAVRVRTAHDERALGRAAGGY
jgi:hypothetical protein